MVWGMTCLEKIRELCARAIVAEDDQIEAIIAELQATIRFWRDLQEERTRRKLPRAA
jgi:hypothetical protein